jgi:hypothetical protein
LRKNHPGSTIDSFDLLYETLCSSHVHFFDAFRKSSALLVKVLDDNRNEYDGSLVDADRRGCRMCWILDSRPAREFGVINELPAVMASPPRPA